MKKAGLLFVFLTISLFLSMNLVFANQLKVTNNHPFLINGNWIEASKLQVGDLLTTIDGKKARITGIQDIEEKNPFLVYNLEDSFFHNYIVDGLVVHNSPTLAQQSVHVYEDTVEGTIVPRAIDSSKMQRYFWQLRNQARVGSPSQMQEHPWMTTFWYFWGTFSNTILDKLGISCSDRLFQPMRFWGLRLGKSFENKNLVDTLFKSKSFLVYPENKIIFSFPDKSTLPLENWQFIYLTKRNLNDWGRKQFFFANEEPIHVGIVTDDIRGWGVKPTDKPLLVIENAKGKKALESSPDIWAYIQQHFNIFVRPPEQ